MKMKKNLGVAIIIFMFVSFGLTGTVTSAAAQELSGKTKELYEAAKKEGELVLSVIAVGADKALDEFRRQYPGIKTVLIPSTAGHTASKFRVEMDAGRKPEFDVADVTMSTANMIKPEEAARVDWTEYGVRPSKILSAGTSYDHRFLYWYDMSYVVSYNTDLLKPSDLPKSWYELLDKKWYGKIVVDPRGHGIRTRSYFTDPNECLEYARRLTALKPTFAQRAGSQNTKAVISGEVSIAFDDSLDNILLMQKKGAPIDWLRTIKQISIEHKWYWTPAIAAHPNAARLFMSWAVSDQGAAYYEGVSNRSVLTHEGGSKLAKILKEEDIKVYSSENFDPVALKNNSQIGIEAAKIFGTYK